MFGYSINCYTIEKSSGWTKRANEKKSQLAFERTLDIALVKLAIHLVDQFLKNVCWDSILRLVKSVML